MGRTIQKKLGEAASGEWDWGGQRVWLFIINSFPGFALLTLSVCYFDMILK